MSNYQGSGWSNKQTWNLNLRYEEIFRTMAEDQEYDDVHHLADSFESLVNELEFETLQENTLASEAVREFLNRVDWEELAEHYFVEKETEEEETLNEYQRELFKDVPVD